MAFSLADINRGVAAKVVVEQPNGRIDFRAALGRSRCVKHTQPRGGAACATSAG